MKRAVAKAQVVLLLVILLVAAVSVSYIAQKELTKKSSSLTSTPTPGTAPGPTLTPTPAATSTPLNAVSSPVFPVSTVQTYNPGGPINPAGPTVEVTLQNNETNPVVSLQAILAISGDNFTYVFNDVSESNPLLPSQDASQTEILAGGEFETNQTYPMEISGSLLNGTTFDFTTSVTINVQNFILPVASGESGNLELIMTLDNTTFSLGEPVNITLTITNISNQTINYEHTGLDFDFQVNNDTNNLVYQWSNFQAIPQFIALVPLPAGESRSANSSWLQKCNFNLQVEGDQVSPGTYSISGETGPTYGIQTTPIQITIG